MKDNRSNEIPPIESRLIWMGATAHPPLGLVQPIIVNTNNKYLDHNEWFNNHKPSLLEKIKIMRHGKKYIKTLREKHSSYTRTTEAKDG